MGLEFIIKQLQGETKSDLYNGRENVSIHIWTPPKNRLKPLWDSDVKALPTPYRLATNIPDVFLVQNSHLYMGTDDGNVIKVSINDLDVTTYGPRELPYHEGMFPTSIRSMTVFGDDVYYASYAGLYRIDHETGKEELVDERPFSTIENIQGLLLGVPHGPKVNWPRDESRESFKASHATHLINVISEEVMMEKVEPFDGSGCRPGTHYIAGGKLYMTHGNWPFESITIRSCEDGSDVKKVSIPTSKLMTEHMGVVYDLRYGGDMPAQVVRSDDDQFPSVERLFEIPQGCVATSMVSAGKRGMLLGLYSTAEDKTMIVSHLKPDKVMLELPGEASMHYAYRRNL